MKLKISQNVTGAVRRNSAPFSFTTESGPMRLSMSVQGKDVQPDDPAWGGWFACNDNEAPMASDSPTAIFLRPT